uniref:BTB domain-containing protein n=1 Tax=Panagrolaimus sp. ES5 TaxID=591445 RepID=A0AC34FWB4_9BILA
MSEYIMAHEWIISEDRLRALKDSTNNEHLKSDFFTAAVGVSVIEYCLGIFPNGHSNNHRGQTWIGLVLKLGNEKKVEAECTFFITTANLSKTFTQIKNRNCAIGYTVDQFFDLKNKFIVEGKFTLKVELTLKMENAESKAVMELLKANWNVFKNFKDMWNIGFEDFTISAGKHKIKVHKCVLASNSPFFAKLFNDKLEKKIGIPNFPFEIVEMAVKLLYHCDLVSDISVKEAILLFKFAEKYSIAMLKINLEDYLSDMLAVSNVCEIVNCATSVKSVKLQTKCLEYFIECLSKKKFVPNLLDKNFLITALTTFSCHKPENQVYKCVLACNSPVLAKMLNDGPEIHITGFSFKIVEMAAKLLYHRDLVSDISVKDAILLLKFAEKYSIAMLKDNLESFLGDEITVKNVCEIINGAVTVNSFKLHKKCLDYFTNCLSMKYQVPNMKLLDKTFLIAAITNLTCQKSETLFKGERN